MSRLIEFVSRLDTRGMGACKDYLKSLDCGQVNTIRQDLEVALACCLAEISTEADVIRTIQEAGGGEPDLEKMSVAKFIRIASTNNITIKVAHNK